MTRFVLTFILLFSSLTLSAQISGSTSAKNFMRKSVRAPRAKLSTQITLDGNYQTGNTERINLIGSFAMSEIDSLKEFSVNGKFLYAQVDKKVKQREYRAGISYDYHPFSNFSPFLCIEFYRNEFKKINAYNAGTIGIKHRYFVKKKVLDYSISTAFIYDLEYYVSDTKLLPKTRCRLSIRPKFKHYLTEDILLIAEGYYKPNLFSYDDFILCGNINLNLRVFKKGLIRITYEYEYNNKPATKKVDKMDALLLAGVGVTF